MSVQTNKLNAYLGFAQRAGKLVSGEMAVLSAFKKNKVRLVMLAEDSSFRIKKKLKSMCANKNISLVEYSSKEKLGNIIGELPRSVLAITDEHFAEIILAQF